MDYGACAERMHFAAMAAADATNAKRLLPPRRQPRSTRYFFRKLELDDWTWSIGSCFRSTFLTSISGKYRILKQFGMKSFRARI